MDGMDSPLGKMIYARDGGLTGGVDTDHLKTVLAEARLGAKPRMEVKGVALRPGVVGHFPNFGPLRIEAGALIHPSEYWGKANANVFFLMNHDTSRILGRTDNDTGDVAFSDKLVTYAVALNPDDPDAQSAWAKVIRGDMKDSSVGCVPLEGEYVKAVDNGLRADPAKAGEEIDVLSITKAVLIEVSLVGTGAFLGATTMPARQSYQKTGMTAEDEGKLSAELGVTAPEVDKPTAPDYAEPQSENGDNDGPTDDSPPAGEPTGDQGDEPAGGGDSEGGPTAAESGEDVGGGGEVESTGEVERQGMTVKDMLRTMERYGLRVQKEG